MLISFLIIFLAVAADFATKQLAAANLAGAASMPVIEGVLHFTYVENTGAAFGMLQDHRWVFMVLSSVAIVALVAYLLIAKPKETAVRVSLALIIAGGVGNMIDRIAYGYVVDFIDVQLIDFYVFNVADSCVCVGCGLLILWLIIAEIKEVKKSKAAVGASDETEAVGGASETAVDKSEAASKTEADVTASEAASKTEADGTASEAASKTEADGTASEADEKDGDGR